MNITISGRHMELSESAKSYVREKTDKLKKYFSRITEIKTVLSKENNGFFCEVIIGLPKHKNIVVEKEAGNLFSAIDRTTEICERKLRQFKEKLQDSNRAHQSPEEQL